MNLYVIVILIAFILRMIYVVSYQYFYWKIQKLPHLELALTLSNNYDLYFGDLSIYKHVFKLYNTYKKARYYGLFDCLNPIILIRDPDLIRKVCEENFENFSVCVLDKVKDPIVSRNLNIVTGQHWERMRRKMNSIYNIKNRRDFFDKISSCANNFVTYLSRHHEEAETLDVKEAFKRFISNATISVTFGMNDDALSQPTDFYICSRIACSSPSAIRSHIMNMFPRLMQFLGITYLPKTIDRYFRNLIKESKQNMLQPSIVHSMLESRNDHQDDVAVTEDDIIGQVIDIISKSYGASCSLMTFTCLLLAKHEEIQIKLYQELIKYFPDENEAITYEKITEMKYLDMVIKESLRLYPSLMLTTRICVEDIMFPSPMDGYPEYQVKKGTILTIPIIGIHCDPNYYQCPHDFIPERFSDENKNKINPYTYLPFGIGPRKCLGEDFAIMETKIFISSILEKFVIKCTEDTRKPVKFLCRTILTTVQDLKLKFELRKKDN